MSDNRGINIKALALGVLTDIGGSLIVSFALFLVVGTVLVAQGVPQNQVAAHLEGRAIFLVPFLIVGFGSTLLGGFVAGRVSKNSEVMHGGLVGLIGLLAVLLFWGSSPLWYGIVSLLGVVPAGLVGGRLSVVTRPRIYNGAFTE